MHKNPMKNSVRTNETHSHTNIVYTFRNCELYTLHALEFRHKVRLKTHRTIFHNFRLFLMDPLHKT